MRSEDAPQFEAVMQDLCLAFNRPYTTELSGVFWDALKWAHIADVRRMATGHRNTAKKFPTPKDLMPERTRASAPERSAVDLEQWSPWALAANKILLAVAYQDERRGMVPMGDKLPRLLAIKRDYVAMAEQSEARGEAWDSVEFNRMCREGFQKALGTV